MRAEVGSLNPRRLVEVLPPSIPLRHRRIHRQAVVTGGAGFIGSHLLRALTDAGSAGLCIDRPGAATRWIDDLDVESAPGALDDAESLRRRVDGADVVFHLAGLTCARSAEEFNEVNTVGTERVLRAAALCARPPHVILMSSLAAVGPPRDGEVLGPDSAPRPISAYGRSKLQAEILMHRYSDRVPTTIVRLPSVYGPRETAVLTLFRMIRRGVALTTGSWDRTISMIYVKDVVQGLVSMAGHPDAAGKTYVLAHPEPLTWRRIASTIGEVVGRRPRLVTLTPSAGVAIATAAEMVARLRDRPALLNRGRMREITARSWLCDPSLAIDEVGFDPAYPLARGLAETAAWYREVRWL
jgi:nucleoside-diphosphate-sugar epimerase